MSTFIVAVNTELHQLTSQHTNIAYLCTPVWAVRVCVCACVQTCTHAQRDNVSTQGTRTHTCTGTHTHTRTQLHTLTRSLTHTHAHNYVHTQIHMR